MLKRKIDTIWFIAMLVSIVAFLAVSYSAVNAGSNCSVASIAPLIANFTNLQAVSYNLSSITAVQVSNYTALPDAGGPFFATTQSNNFCNVTLTMTHIGLNDTVRALSTSM